MFAQGGIPEEHKEKSELLKLPASGHRLDNLPQLLKEQKSAAELAQKTHEVVDGLINPSLTALATEASKNVEGNPANASKNPVATEINALLQKDSPLQLLKETADLQLEQTNSTLTTLANDAMTALGFFQNRGFYDKFSSQYDVGGILDDLKTPGKTRVDWLKDNAEKIAHALKDACAKHFEIADGVLDLYALIFPGNQKIIRLQRMHPNGNAPGELWSSEDLQRFDRDMKATQQDLKPKLEEMVRTWQKLGHNPSQIMNFLNGDYNQMRFDVESVKGQLTTLMRDVEAQRQAAEATTAVGLLRFLEQGNDAVISVAAESGLQKILKPDQYQNLIDILSNNAQANGGDKVSLLQLAAFEAHGVSTQQLIKDIFRRNPALIIKLSEQLQDWSQVDGRNLRFAQQVSEKYLTGLKARADKTKSPSEALSSLKQYLTEMSQPAIKVKETREQVEKSIERFDNDKLQNRDAADTYDDLAKLACKLLGMGEQETLLNMNPLLEAFTSRNLRRALLAHLPEGSSARAEYANFTILLPIDGNRKMEISITSALNIAYMSLKAHHPDGVGTVGVMLGYQFNDKGDRPKVTRTASSPVFGLQDVTKNLLMINDNVKKVEIPK
ncbi:MAG TPA: hypothetical protein VD999_04215 [Vitreimonas sp.]|nr:hypothetical protein [Vitreimonas sp.]